MHLPKEPFKIHGGCNCKAIRYEISVPPWDERPQPPNRTPGIDVEGLRVPGIYLDHCNDCRRATSAILPTVIVAEAKTIQASVLPQDARTKGPFKTSDIERTWHPASQIFSTQNPDLQNTYLSVYESSTQRYRWFCSRCGTSLAYSVDPDAIPASWGWPVMLDFWLGTVDREDLEKEFMKPERMLWCEKAVPWIYDLARKGSGGIPEHPLMRADKIVGDDVSEEREALEGLEREK